MIHGPPLVGLPLRQKAKGGVALRAGGAGIEWGALAAWRCALAAVLLLLLLRPISSNGLTGVKDLGCTQTDSDQLCVVLSPFESQKTLDLGLSRREVFKDVLGWS